MSSQYIKEYHDATEHREVRSDLTFAVNIAGEPKIAIDCGCGAGADIQYLLEKGFKVYGFDIEEESISRCKERFKNNKDVILSKAGFSSYKYPKASLVVADASLPDSCINPTLFLKQTAHIQHEPPVARLLLDRTKSEVQKTA